ncbi:hypothetical protein ACMG4J_22630 [Rossellomorea marisflavi]|uniref:hypothetical protein n=1 Tax=Rossellomorea marisflavi TaxID=189381 RepID=UPI0039BF8F35
MQLVENMDVYCETATYTGEGIIHAIIPGEMFGYQVLLSEPDEDGHRVKRFARHEIRTDQKEETIPEPDEKMLGTRNNETYIITRSPYADNGKQVHYYDPHTNKMRGGCSLSEFTDIKPFDINQIPQKKIEAPLKKGKKTAGEQLAFDFWEA